MPDLYAVFILRRAQKALSKLPGSDYKRVREALRGLASNPRPNKSKKLTARDGWRIRVGAYRVVYSIEDPVKKVTILDIAHRKSIYR